jgi:hypothetical protein
MSIGNVSEVIKPATIARILGMMARTHNDLQVIHTNFVNPYRTLTVYKVEHTALFSTF